MKCTAAFGFASFHFGRAFKSNAFSRNQLAPAGFYRCIRAPRVSVLHFIANAARYRFCAIALTLAKRSLQTSANLKEGGETFLRKFKFPQPPCRSRVNQKKRSDVFKFCCLNGFCRLRPILRPGRGEHSDILIFLLFELFELFELFFNYLNFNAHGCSR